jgi:hypothetical protein
VFADATSLAVIGRIGDEQVTGPSIRLCHAQAGLPPLTADGLAFRDGDGQRCVVIVAHRIRSLGRTWQPVKSVLKRFRKPPHPPV